MRTQGNNRENAGNLILIRIWQPRNCVIEFLFTCIFLSSIPSSLVIDKMLVSILRLLAHFSCLIFNPHTASRVLSIWLPRNTGSKTYCCKFDDTRDCGVFSLWTKLFFLKKKHSHLFWRRSYINLLISCPNFVRKQTRKLTRSASFVRKINNIIRRTVSGMEGLFLWTVRTFFQRLTPEGTAILKACSFTNCKLQQLWNFSVNERCPPLTNV